MPDWPKAPKLEPFGVLHIGSLEAIGADLPGITGLFFNAASAAWPVASRAIGFPFSNLGERDFVVASAWWLNGSAAMVGNVCVAVYDERWRRLATTGSVAQAGAASALQSAPMAVTLPPGGPYYLMLVSDSASAQFYRSGPSFGVLATLGCIAQSSAFPLPDPLVPVLVSSNYLPFFGLTERSFL